MWPFSRKHTASAEPAGATAVAERPVDPLEEADAATLRTELERLEAANRTLRSGETEQRLLMVRHLLGARLRDEAPAAPRHPDPTDAPLPPAGAALPEIAAADVTPELLRAGILRDGCLLVRGLVARDDARALAGEIDRAYAERERVLAGQDASEGYYEEFDGDGRFDADLGSRVWIRQGGGLLAGDSPRLAFALSELLRGANFPALVERYLGEPPLISFEKTTLRRATPDIPGAWHQDGKFMGPVRSLNLWLALTRCGDQAPGLDIVPRRLEEYATTQTDEAMLDYQVSQRHAEAVAGDHPIVRPIFEPGDALLFDEKLLHQTASDPAMPNPRYAVESWFFGGSGFPDFVPLAV